MFEHQLLSEQRFAHTHTRARRYWHKLFEGLFGCCIFVFTINGADTECFPLLDTLGCLCWLHLLGLAVCALCDITKG